MKMGAVKNLYLFRGLSGVLQILWFHNPMHLHSNILQGLLRYKENATFLLQLKLLILLDCLDPRLDVLNVYDFPRFIGGVRLACLSSKYYRNRD